MKKLLSIFLSLTIILSTAAVFSVSASAASKTGKKYVSYKTVNKTIKKQGVLILKGKIQYPVLKSKSSAAKKVNKKIKNNVKKFADNIISMAKNDYSANGVTNFTRTGWHYEYKVTAKLTYNANGKYSYRISYYGYTMGAHGYEQVAGYTYKKSNGKKLSNAKTTKYSGSELKKKIVDKMEKTIKIFTFLFCRLIIFYSFVISFKPYVFRLYFFIVFIFLYLVINKIFKWCSTIHIHELFSY